MVSLCELEECAGEGNGRLILPYNALEILRPSFTESTVGNLGYIGH
jgi:hypothetical protein